MLSAIKSAFYLTITPHQRMRFAEKSGYFAAQHYQAAITKP
jgi:hypothetical protein